MLGLIIVPTAIITGTPLDCNFCQVTAALPSHAKVREKVS